MDRDRRRQLAFELARVDVDPDDGATERDVRAAFVPRVDRAELRTFRPAVYGEINKAFKGVKPASTGIVVAGLALPELLMEIDAWGIVDD